MGFVHVGQDLEEQEELLECLLAFYMQYLLATDAVTCINLGMPCPSGLAWQYTVAVCMQYVLASNAFTCIRSGILLSATVALAGQLFLKVG